MFLSTLVWLHKLHPDRILNLVPNYSLYIYTFVKGVHEFKLQEYAQIKTEAWDQTKEPAHDSFNMWYTVSRVNSGNQRRPTCDWVYVSSLSSRTRKFKFLIYYTLFVRGDIGKGDFVLGDFCPGGILSGGLCPDTVLSGICKNKACLNRPIICLYLNIRCVNI